jgi:hypothetical protein
MKLNKSKTMSAVAIAAAFVTLGASPALAKEVDVTPSALDHWQVQNDGTSTVTFVNGPANPPCGIGSAQFTVDSSGETASQLRNTNYAGTLLSDLTQLSYSTFVTRNNGGQAGNGGQAVYIILNIDLDGNGTIDDQLFFEPVYQSATYFPSNSQGPIALNTWQSWNALTGGWWSLDGIAGANPGTGVKSLHDYIAAQPNARIVNSATGRGGVRLVAGFGGPTDWGNFLGNADCFRIATNGGSDTTYDFEIGAESCKNGGWQTFDRADGTHFKNQGDCVQYENTGK